MMLTPEEVETAIGRPLTWFERVGFWWDRVTSDGRTSPTQPPTSILGAIGDLSEAAADTTIGTAIGNAAQGTVDTAEGAVKKVTGFRSLLIFGAVGLVVAAVGGFVAGVILE